MSQANNLWQAVRARLPLLVGGALLGLTGGCQCGAESAAPAPTAAQPKPAEKSVLKEVSAGIHDTAKEMTGLGALERGQDLTKQIRKLETEHNQKLDQVMQETKK